MLDSQGTQTHALMVAQTSGRGGVPDRDDWQARLIRREETGTSAASSVGKHVPISKP